MNRNFSAYQLKNIINIEQLGSLKSIDKKMKNLLQCQSQDSKLFLSNNSQNVQKIPIKKQPAKLNSYYPQTSGHIINKEEYIKQTVTEEKMVYRMQIFVLMVLMTLCILLISNYDNLLQLQVIRNQKIVSSYDSSLGDSMEIRYKFCPEHTNTFHVNCNYKENNLQQNSNQFAKQVAFCRIPVLGNSNLLDLIIRWNSRFPNHIIKMQETRSKDKKQDLLVLLKLYFFGGTFIGKQIMYSQIDQRSQKYALTGFEIIFIDYSYKNEKGIYVPNHKKFMKSRFPYSPQIKFMIDQLLSQKDILQQCQQRQCLIIKSSE